jgi:hypothetical protein
VQIEPLTRDRDAGHDLTARLAKALVLLDEPVAMKRVLVDDDALPALALCVDGEVHTVSPEASKADLLELLDNLLNSQEARLVAQSVRRIKEV